MKIMTYGKRKPLVSKATLAWGIVLGVLLIACGVACFIVPDTGYKILSYSIGAIIFLIGVMEMIGFYRYWLGLLGGSWILADAILTIIFGILLLLNETAVEVILPYFAGFYIVTMGFVRFIGSFDLMSLRIPNWWGEMLLGLLDIILGITFCFLPGSGALTIVVCMGILLVVSGISLIGDMVYFFKMKRFAKKYAPIDEDVK